MVDRLERSSSLACTASIRKNLIITLAPEAEMASSWTDEMDGLGTNWPDVKAWRRAQRAELISKRTALDRDRRETARAALIRHIQDAFPWLRAHTIGFYWPIQGEPDLRKLVQGYMEMGAAAGLPVVVEKRQPVEFWRWRPGMRMVRGDWNIPQPPTREPVRPTALLVPLLGFAGYYRLGYGAGYYDRTLAALRPRPWAIGVGLEMGRLSTIHPQPHDIAMDAIVTESGGWLNDTLKHDGARRD